MCNSTSLNTTVTASDELILQEVGLVVLSNFGNLITVTLLYGIFLTLFCTSVQQKIRRGINTPASWAIIVGTSINLAVQTALWIMLLTNVIFQLQIFLVHNGDQSLAGRINLELKNEDRIAIPASNIQPAQLAISDAFVIWRAWVLFPDRKWLMVIPVFCFLGSIGASIALLAIPLHANGAPVLSTMVALSFATNFITTLMISWRLWIFRKHVVPKLGKTTPSPVYRTIITLVESGALYCVIQLATLIIQVRGSHANFISEIDGTIQVALYSLAAMYPTIVVILCHTYSSRIDEVGSMSTIRANELRFARSMTQTSQFRSSPVSAWEDA